MSIAVNKKQLSVPFVDLAAQYAEIASEVQQAIDGVLTNTDFILGRDVRAFEKVFGRLTQVLTSA